MKNTIRGSYSEALWFAGVTMDEKPLRPAASQKVWNQSPTGFAWGYGGSGPAQLALAILLEAGVPSDTAVKLHQHFKWQFIARLPGSRRKVMSSEAPKTESSVPTVPRRGAASRLISIGLWAVSLLAAVFAAIDFVLSMHGASNAPQQAAIAGSSACIAIIPYVLARAWDEMTRPWP